MRFITFIKSLPQQEDKDVNEFILWTKRAPVFPQSSDPRMLGIFLANKLDEKLTQGYFKTMMVFRHLHGKSLPKDLEKDQDFINALNTIVNFQQNR